MGAQIHLVTENRTPALPVYSGDATSDTAQHGLYCSRLQVQVGRQGSTKVTVGWGTGPSAQAGCPQQALGRADGYTVLLLGGWFTCSQGPFLAPGHDQGQGKGRQFRLFQAPTPTQASTPGLDPISMAGAESYPLQL